MARLQGSLWGRVVTRNQSQKSSRLRRGGISIQMLVILVPVIFGFMGFAVDLGRLYLVKGELNQAASAMAMAAAQQLNGTDQAVEAAGGAAQSLLDDSLHDASRYNFGSIVIGQATLALTSTVAEPALFATVADAIAAAGQTGAASTADGTTARHVTINMNADAPLLFWSLLTLGQSRHVSVAATAVAGISAPLCTACGIEPFAIAAIAGADPTDLNFGYTQDTIYTFGYQCTGAQPAVLAGSTVRVPYLMIDRYDTGQALDEPSQAFRLGAGGLPADATVDTNSTPSSVTYECLRIANAENVWANAPTRACDASAHRRHRGDVRPQFKTNGLDRHRGLHQRGGIFRRSPDCMHLTFLWI